MKISKKKIFSFALLLSFSALFFIFGGGVSEIQAQSRMNEQDLYKNQVGMSEVKDVYGGNQPEDIRIVATKIIQWVLGFLGLIFLVLIIFAGFKWMTSGGNEEEVKKAQALMKNAVIGLIIILAAWTITYYLITVFRRTIIDQSVDYTTIP
ncbi:hypothetical protein JXK06_02340 [Patescibacteria group bacterium]|nr:hypothetical protein [Patescibacteria group bacterium]